MTGKGKSPPTSSWSLIEDGTRGHGSMCTIKVNMVAEGRAVLSV